MRHYCTYFDRGYLGRGLALLESLRSQEGPFRLHVLCLDAESAAKLHALSVEELVPVTLDTLEGWDGELAAAKENRSRIAYYFTLTGALARFLFHTRAEIDLLTYLDADLFFFGDPEAVFAEIADASAAIVPHRFSPQNIGLRASGLFNVGWLSWRRDRVGLACLEDYRRDCLNWCHDYVDGDRFADQRYLDTWPMRYPGVKVIGHKGANLAPWNLDTDPLSLRDGRVMVDGSPLIFFHFHRLRRTADGFQRNLEPYLRNCVGRPESSVIEAIYAPYEAMLERLEPATSLPTLRDPPPTPSPDRWEWRPMGWVRGDEAVPGWNTPTAIEAMTERFAIMQRRLGTTLPVGGDIPMHNELVTIAYAAARAAGNGSLSVLDWEGGLGSCCLALRMLLPELSIDYHCREEAGIAEHGRRLLPDATFHDRDDSALDRRYDLVIGRATLHRREDWQKVLARLAGATDRFMVVTRTPMVCSVPSFVMVQHAFGGDYRTAWQFWAVSLTEFLTTVEASGLETERQFPVQPHPAVPQAPEQPELRGFLLTRRYAADPASGIS